MSGDNDEIRNITSALSEIANTLDSVDDPESRIERVMRLMRTCVPYRQCALLRAERGGGRKLLVVPQVAETDLPELEEKLKSLLGIVEDAEIALASTGRRPHLALPLVGLDRVMGVVRIEPSPELEYQAEHLRLFSVIAAQLGAYLATVRLHEEHAAAAREVAAAHDFQHLMAGVVSHDLRNPLSVIMSAASVLLRAPSAERQVKPLTRILASVRLADRIISDLMDATRIRAGGGLHVNPQPAEFVSLVTEVVNDSRLAHPGRLIEVSASARAIHGKWDEARVAQLVTNLINNAFMHGAADSPVEVAVQADADAVVVSVRNRGANIPASLMDNLFDPFRRGHDAPRTDKKGGLGLGLYIVSQIAAAHGGTIEVRSVPGEGATMFTARLPIGGLRATTEDLSFAGAPARDVLVIDDANETRRQLAEVLTARGFVVHQAENGLEGLQVLRTLGRPSVVVLDLAMPVMDGWEFERQLRADPDLRTTRVIVVSGSSPEPLIPPKVAAVLPKPVDLTKLLRVLLEDSSSDPHGALAVNSGQRSE